MVSGPGIGRSTGFLNRNLDHVLDNLIDIESTRKTRIDPRASSMDPLEQTKGDI